ncbi:MAG: ArnT family glycosyltransferase, partial [Paracoccaceae bacterium]
MFDQKTAVFWSFIFILALTSLRVLALAVTPTDLFVDEAQYWFWGQNLDFGYYSKPPLIAWLIRFVTELAESSEAFWVRLPAPLLHGITAVLLGIFAARRFGRGAGAWVAAGYISLPIVAVGSFMISTDTVLAPFYVLALIFYDQAQRSGSLRAAAFSGATLGLAFMA